MSRLILNATGSLLRSSCFQLNSLTNAQQVRTTYILRRRSSPCLSKVGGKQRRFQRKDFVYELVENTNATVTKIKLILVQDIAGIGSAGDVIDVKEDKARVALHHKEAIYASPENLSKLEEQKAQGMIPEKRNSSVWAPLTAKRFSTMTLSVIMHMENPWTLQPWHIRVSFRKAGYVVPEHAIEMPLREISGPNLEMEGKEFPVKITINNSEWAYVRCRLHHWTANESKQLQPFPDHWKFAAESLFEEDKPLLDGLPIPPEITNVAKNKVVQ